MRVARRVRMRRSSFWMRKLTRRTLVSTAPWTPCRHRILSMRLSAESGQAGGHPRGSWPTVPTMACEPVTSVATCATQLRNTVSEVLRQVEGGERVTVTVDRRPVAELVPLNRRRAVSLEQARQVVSRHAADRGLLDELKGVLADTTDEL